MAYLVEVFVIFYSQHLCVGSLFLALHPPSSNTSHTHISHTHARALTRAPCGAGSTCSSRAKGVRARVGDPWALTYCDLHSRVAWPRVCAPVSLCDSWVPSYCVLHSESFGFAGVLLLGFALTRACLGRAAIGLCNHARVSRRHVTSRRVPSCHLRSHHVAMLCRIMSCHVMSTCHVPRRVMSRHVAPFSVTSCRVAKKGPQHTDTGTSLSHTQTHAAHTHTAHIHIPLAFAQLTLTPLTLMRPRSSVYQP